MFRRPDDEPLPPPKPPRSRSARVAWMVLFGLGGLVLARASLATVVEIGWTTEDKAGRTQEVLTRGCDQHDGLSCAKLFFAHVGGKYTLTQAALRSIAPELEKSCEDARALVCAAWGTALKKGLGTGQDTTKGEDVYAKACARRSIDCTELPQ